MARGVDTRNPTSVAGLHRVAQKEWRALTTDKPYVHALFFSMEKRLREVVKKRGGAIDF